MTDTEPGANETEPVEPPRIYVASLTDYNHGVLHGTWLDATQPLDELQAGIDEMLAGSPTTRRYGDKAEEWAIHDTDGFGPARLSEYEPLDAVVTLAQGIHRHGPAFAAWWAHDERPDDIDPTETFETFERCYLGEHASVSDYAEQLLEDLGIYVDELPGIPADLWPYIRIDHDAYAQGLQASGAIYTTEAPTGIWIFTNE